jgi:hypothetical protein
VIVTHRIGPQTTAAGAFEGLLAMEYLFRHHVLSDLEMVNLPDGAVAKVRQRGGRGDWWTARITNGVAMEASEHRPEDAFLGRNYPPISLDELDVVVLPDTDTLKVWLQPYNKMRAAHVAAWNDLWRQRRP